MCPAFDFNPTESTAGFQVFPKNTYQIELGEPKVFFRKGKDGKEDNFGIMFVSKVVEGEFKGKKRILNCYMHTPESRDYSKQLQMAALGYDPKNSADEEKFDAIAKGMDWKFNPDDNTCGDGWHKMKGQVIVEELDIKMDKDGNAQQKAVSVKPLVSAS